MKKYIISFAFILSYIYAFTQNEKTIKTNVKKAIVYLQGAQLNSTETVSLSAGNNRIVFEGISPHLQEASIQASGKGSFVILETQYQLKYKEKTGIKTNGKYDKVLGDIEDSLEENLYKKSDAENRYNTLELEKKMLMGNKIIKGESQKDSLPLLKDGLDFLRQRLNNIMSEQLKISRELKRVAKSTQDLEKRKQDIINLQNGFTTELGASEPVPQIIVTIFAEAATIGTITIGYYIPNASWTPFYELHGDGTTNMVQLKQLATIQQNSGLDWKDAAITLSTATPNQNSTKPQLPIWYIYNQSVHYTESIKNIPAAKQNSQAYRNNGGINQEVPTDADKEEKNAEDMSEYTYISQNILLTEFELKLKYIIPSDGQKHYVAIQNKELAAKYFFSAVPKLDTKAFLMAQITGWEDLNLIPGNAKIYFDGNLAGTTAINPDITSDTMLLNMGRDHSFVIQKRKLKDECKEKILHDEVIKIYTYEIVIKNTKAVSLNMKIEDQIPVVQTGIEDVKVVLKESNGAYYNDQTGKLTWDYKLGAKESKKIIFSFEVRSPKGKVLAGL